MEGCTSTEKDIDKLLTKFESFKKQNLQILDQLHQQYSKVKAELSQSDQNELLSNPHKILMSQHNKKLKASSQKLSSQHKDLHSNVSRIGKTIDRNFDAECSSVTMPEICTEKNEQRLLNTAICEHFYRQGSLTVAETISSECGLEIDEKWRKPFVEMNEILHSLRNKELELALAWTLKNKDKLRNDKNNLDFKLHRLKFLQLLKQGPSKQLEALAFSKNFQQFSSQHSHEIQQLMGCFLYLKQDFSLSPYSSLFTEAVWDDACCSFSQEACHMMGMSIDSPLMTVFAAGCQALPALVAIRSVIEQRQLASMLSNNDEIPIDIDLENSMQYHSVFACPILRQQTTSKNPPLRLVCGHVISKDALTKLVSGGKVKCPYCPVEQPYNEAKEIYY